MKREGDGGQPPWAIPKKARRLPKPVAKPILSRCLAHLFHSKAAQTMYTILGIPHWLYFVILISSLFLAALLSALGILRMKKSCRNRPWTSWWTLHTGCRWMAWCLTCQNSHQVSPVVDLVFCEKWKVPKPNTQVHHHLKLLWQWHLAQVQVSVRLHQPVQPRHHWMNLEVADARWSYWHCLYLNWEYHALRS